MLRVGLPAPHPLQAQDPHMQALTALISSSRRLPWQHHACFSSVTHSFSNKPRDFGAFIVACSPDPTLTKGPNPFHSHPHLQFFLIINRIFSKWWPPYHTPKHTAIQLAQQGTQHPSSSPNDPQALPSSLFLAVCDACTQRSSTPCLLTPAECQPCPAVPCPLL